MQLQSEYCAPEKGQTLCPIRHSLTLHRQILDATQMMSPQPKMSHKTKMRFIENIDEHSNISAS